jgi:hypothetical protein
VARASCRDNSCLGAADGRGATGATGCAARCAVWGCGCGTGRVAGAVRGAGTGRCSMRTAVDATTRSVCGGTSAARTIQLQAPNGTRSACSASETTNAHSIGPRSRSPRRPESMSHVSTHPVPGDFNRVTSTNSANDGTWKGGMRCNRLIRVLGKRRSVAKAHVAAV